MESTRKETPPKPPVRAAAHPFLATIGVAILLATLFTAWSPNSLFADNLRQQLSLILTPQAELPSAAGGSPQPALRLGLVAGHNASDSGAVCVDENGEVTLTEAEVNKKIADLARGKLLQRGYQVDLLNEFDTRLSGYSAVALVSIHNDSCEYINDEATGFKVTSSAQTVDRNRAQRLTACLADRYARITGLTFHAGSITADMREYHAFSEINPNTVTAIIETGFLYLDREILTQQTERVAEGVAQGILCYLNNESVEPTPMPETP